MRSSRSVIRDAASWYGYLWRQFAIALFVFVGILAAIAGISGIASAFYLAFTA